MRYGQPRRFRLSAEALEPKHLLTTFTVTHGDDAGVGSLRWAIEQANSSSDDVFDTIEFDIFEFENDLSSAFEIAIQSPLPTVAGPTNIDASRLFLVDGSPGIEVTGRNLSGRFPDSPGLVLQGDNSLVRGLRITEFPGGGIEIRADETDISSNQILNNGGVGVVVLGSRNELANNIIGGNVGGMVVGDEQATPAFFGPQPYFSTADLPSGFYSDMCPVTCQVIEDFEDGTLDPRLQIFEGNVIGPGFSSGSDSVSTDSVDIDDGEIDGQGFDAHAFFSLRNEFTIVFPRGVESAGLAWTDGDRGTQTVVEAFGINGELVGRMGPYALADNVFNGTTSEDRFFGFRYKGGISRLRIANQPQSEDQIISGIEIDHIHFSDCEDCGVGEFIEYADNVVTGNWIGLEADGETPLPNTGYGLLVAGQNTTVGGINQSGNVISGNEGDGIVIASSGAVSLDSNNRIQSNVIGLAADTQTPVPNRGNGILVRPNSSQTTIGGPRVGNLIAYNQNAGVAVDQSFLANESIVGVTVRSNSIFQNGTVGIDLFVDDESKGPTPNDAADEDEGPNSFQNYPDLELVVPGASTFVQGSLFSTQDTAFIIDIYAEDESSAQPLGSFTVTTDENGLAEFQRTFDAFTVPGMAIFATATAPDGSTSEFSASILAPDQRISLALAAESDRGVSNTDNVTSDATPRLFGVAPANSLVRILADDTEIGRVESDDIGNGIGTWSLQSSSLPDNIFSLVAIAEDDVQSTIQSDPLLLQIDTVGPSLTVDLDTLSDTGRSTGDNVTSDASPSLLLNANDNRDLLFSENLHYEVFIQLQNGPSVLLYDSADDPTLVDSLLDGLTDQAVLQRTMPVLPDGVHEILLRGTDRAGNFDSISMPLEIDTVAPTGTLTLVDEEGNAFDGSTTFNIPVRAELRADDDDQLHLSPLDLNYRLTQVSDQTELVYDSALDQNIPPSSILDGLTDLRFVEVDLGTLEVASHSFALTIEDRAGNFLTLDQVDLLVTDDVYSINGTKWNDENGNGARDRIIRGDDPDVLFIIDNSFSTTDTFGPPIGDENGNGFAEEVLDAEIFAVRRLIDDLVLSGRGDADIGLMSFNSSARILDLDPEPQSTVVRVPATSPLIEPALRTIQASGSTSFSAPLDAALEFFASTPPDQRNVVFLSDGFPSSTDLFRESASKLISANVNLSAFSVTAQGSPPADLQTSLDNLRVIDPSARQFTDPDDLQGFFSSSDRFTEPGISAVRIFLDLNENGVLDANEPSTLTRDDDPTTPNVDEAGGYSFEQLLPGRYVVREVVPEGFVQSFPQDKLHEITIVDSNIEDIDFGNSVPAEIQIQKWLDVDGDGRRDSVDDLSGWSFYLDENLNGEHDEGEQLLETNADGQVVFSGLLPGLYHVRELAQPGFQQIFPPPQFTTPECENGECLESGRITQVVEAADINGDGRLDLLVTNDIAKSEETANGTAPVTSSLSVFLNQGQGDFVLGQEMSLGQRPQRLVVADIDSDGDQDVAVAVLGRADKPSENENGITVFINDSGFLRFHQFVPIGGSTVDVAAGHFDEDQNIDLVAANFGRNTIALLENTGNGTFRIQSEILVGRDPVSVEAFDVDGAARIAVSLAGQRQVAIVNPFDNTLESHIDSGEGPADTVTADLDLDGTADFVVANYLDNSVTFAFQGQEPFSITVPGRPKSITVADLSLNGLGDVIVSTAELNSVTVLWNQGNRNFDTSTIVNVERHGNSTTTGDFDNDGFVDLATAHLFGTVGVHFGREGFHEIDLFPQGFETREFGNARIANNALQQANPVESFDPADVNRDGFISPRDLLSVIGHLNGNAIDLELKTDVNQDGSVSPRDALLVIMALDKLNHESANSHTEFLAAISHTSVEEEEKEESKRRTS